MALHKKHNLPTHLDLPVEDGIPMEDRFHPRQASEFLGPTLMSWLHETGRQAIVGSNCFVYYELKEPPVGPDFFVVNGGVERGQGSWVVWDEDDHYPTLIVELLSKSTEKKDRVKNFQIYRDVFRTPDYFLYDVRLFRLEGFRLEGGAYLPILPDAEGRCKCSSLPLKLGVHDRWLRWFRPDGTLLQTGDERAAVERQRADAERQRADAERERAREAERRLAEVERRLRDLGLEES